MQVPHDRQFDHESDFFLLERAQWADMDTGHIYLRVVIKDTDDDSEYAFAGYEAHLSPGGETAQALKNLMSYNAEQQKSGWNTLRPQLNRIDPSQVNT